jgi:hypothetical protein
MMSVRGTISFVIKMMEVTEIIKAYTMLNTILPDSELEVLLLVAVAGVAVAGVAVTGVAVTGVAVTGAGAVFKSGFLEAEFSDTLI